MPRDINGNYTLPPGINPVVPGTDIEVDWANPTLDDIALALTDSLSRTGSGGLLVPMKFADGSIGAPAITWTNQPQAGFYRAANSDFRYVINGVDVLQMLLGAVKSLVPLGVPNGTVAAPGLSWNNEAASGWYRNAAGDFRFAIAGVDVLEVRAGALRLVDGITAAPAYSWSAEINSGWYRKAGGDFWFAVGGVDVFGIDAAGVTVNGSITSPVQPATLADIITYAVALG